MLTLRELQELDVAFVSLTEAFDLTTSTGRAMAAEKDPRRLITDYLSQRIETGTVSDRASMVLALREANLEVTRQGKDYITAADPESGGRWRLKGAIYEQDFQRGRLDGSAATEDRAGPNRDRGGGSWGLTRWYANNIQNLIQRRAALTRQVEREQTRLDQLRAQTWGVGLHECVTGVVLMGHLTHYEFIQEYFYMGKHTPDRGLGRIPQRCRQIF